MLLLFLLIFIQTPYAWENYFLVHISQSLATIEQAVRYIISVPQITH